jgi:DNA-binding HxlR family transcriptional regulator
VYALTPLGRTLFAPLRTLRQWAQDNAAAIEAAHRRYDALQTRRT